MSHFSLSLLGSFQATLDDEPAPCFESDKVRALLAYLAVEADQPQRREKLAGLLWPDRPERNARQNLSQALFNLRKVLGDREASSPFLLVTPKTLQFNQSSDSWVDTIAFEQILTRCQVNRHACDVCLESLDQAIARYSGDFLEGLSLKDSPGFEEWALLKREHLRRLLVEALHRAADCHVQVGNTHLALQYIRRWVELEPYQEEGQRRLMALLARNGQRNAALAQYHTCRDMLAEELGVEPTTETTALYKQLSNQDNVLPAASTPVTAPSHNLPAPLTRFVGRKNELDNIGTRLRDPTCRLLSLVGSGGVGKSRLAQEIAAAQREQYPDGVFFIPLAQIESAEAIVSTVARTIGCPLFDQLDPDQQLQTYLRDRQMLLILDNLEHLLVSAEARPVATWLVDLLKSTATVTILVTSRVRLKVSSEEVFEIAGMDYPANTANDDLPKYGSVRLFVQAARRTQPAFSPTPEALQQIARICGLVQGVPLALLLAASWMEILAPADIAAAVEGNLDFLKTNWRDVPRRHRSLRAVFDHSWRLMSGQEQQLFLRLSVFRGGFTHQAAQAVADVPLPMLLSLVDKSLLARTSIGHYELHDLLRQFATEKLEQIPGLRNDAHSRHCTYYLTALQTWGVALRTVSLQAALNDMEDELENGLEAWRWAVDQQAWAQLEPALDGLCLFFLLRSRYQEGQFVCRQTAEKLTPPTSRLKRQLLGQLLVWQGTLITASKGQADLIQALHMLGHPVPGTRPGATLGVMAQIGRQLWYRLRSGLATDRPPLKIAPQAGGCPRLLFHLPVLRRSFGNTPVENTNLLVAARAYERLTAIYYFSNETTLTLYVALRSLNLAEAAGVSPELARGYATAGSIVSFIPLHGLAGYYFQLARNMVQQVEDVTAKMWVLLVSGLYLAGIGQWEQARNMLEQVTILAERTGDRYRWDDAVGNLAVITFFQGDFDTSLRLSDDFYASARSRADTHNQGWALRGKVFVLIPQDKLEAALTCLTELRALVTTHTDFKDTALKADLFSLLGLVYLKQNEPELALTAAAQALELYSSIRPASYLSLPGYQALAETYLSLWRLGQPFPDYDTNRLKSAAKRACKLLAIFAHIFPIGRPASDICWGQFYWLSGRRRLAYNRWQRGLAEATRLGMPVQPAMMSHEPSLDRPTQRYGLNEAGAKAKPKSGRYQGGQVCAKK
jgi:DNA-binding SARP family transcriptional activator/predicted ATPase